MMYLGIWFQQLENCPETFSGEQSDHSCIVIINTLLIIWINEIILTWTYTTLILFYVGLDAGGADNRVKRSSFLFHPYLPLVLSIQQTYMQPTVVNIHLRLWTTWSLVSERLEFHNASSKAKQLKSLPPYKYNFICFWERRGSIWRS